MLLAYSRGQAWWRGIPHTHATFVKQDFWKVLVIFCGFLESNSCFVLGFFSAVITACSVLTQTDLSKYTNIVAFLAPDVVSPC